MNWIDPANRSRCPCCGYPTLGSRGQYEICQVCWWEDDGQDDPNADEVRGGPNHGYSLAEARRNYRRHGLIYAPDRDPRISAPDSERTTAAKRSLTLAFDRLDAAAPAERESLLAEIRKQERVLQQELKRGIREYEARCRTSRGAEPD